eukprot:1894259-Alexandrium_andersonii.AAC.1
MAGRRVFTVHFRKGGRKPTVLLLWSGADDAAYPQGRGDCAPRPLASGRAQKRQGADGRER